MAASAFCRIASLRDLQPLVRLSMFPLIPLKCFETFYRSHHVESDGNVTVAICSAQRKKIKFFDRPLDHMVIDIGKRFNLFTECSENYRIIEHETFNPIRTGQHIKIDDDLCGEQGDELSPVKPGLVKKPIICVFLTFQNPYYGISYG